MPGRPRIVGVTMATMLLACAGCRVTDWSLWGPAPPQKDAFEVEFVGDVAYYDEASADAARHKLDLYLPKGKKDYPVVVFVHGGAWMFGDNRCCGLYRAVGEFLAGQGIGAVMPNYRLSPFVKHPEHAKDVARAVAWTRTHIADFNGDPGQMFLMGHSAGGHLAALLATDSRYLNGEGMSVADLRGIISVSGVYTIPPGSADVEVGGTTPLGIRLDEVAPIRGVGTAFNPTAREKSGLPVSINVFGPVFGDDAKIRSAASPLNYVRPGLPPFLLISADKDLPLLPKMASDMHQSLLKHGNSSTLLIVEKRNHNSIMFQAIHPGDPVARAVLDFVRAYR
jgi:acetyl esterase/lipase